jgi:cytochrome c biogenesis protein
VTNPIFLVITLFLFLSTCVCTVSRVQKWITLKVSDFSKDRAFSFEREESSSSSIETVRSKVEELLAQGRWEKSTETKDRAVIFSGQKGMSGFWGSVVFHIGLIICFFAGPVSVYTTFRGELVTRLSGANS